VLVLARSLHPDSRGFGTHEQLGLPPCGWLALTDLPCPACGLTTAFAHMARGDLTGAWSAHVFGVVLFGLVTLAVPVCAWAGLRGVPLRAVPVLRHLPRTLPVLLLLWMGSWLARVAF
jgi:hypothetical protein